MKAEVENIIDEYLHFGGYKTAEDFKTILDRLSAIALRNHQDREAIIKLEYIRRKLIKGLSQAEIHGQITVIVTDDEKDLQDFYERIVVTSKGDMGKIKPRNVSGENMGKIVDEGDVPYHRSRSDSYWNEKKINLIFDAYNKQIRSGAQIPKTYFYHDIDFIEKYYDFKGIEFGNWLSQQDRKNYLAGLGLALFDLNNAIGFSAKQLSLKKKITVAFGARGRGAMLAHFEPDTFAINITRYKRPKAGQRGNLHRLLTASGGVGSYAHEFGHALDYFGGFFVMRIKEAISGGRSLRIRPDKKLMAESSVAGLMEKLLFKIIWEKEGKHSSYYAKLLTQNKKGTFSDYYLRRNELFARAFESYVHYKMAKKKYKNIFLAETKYDGTAYLSPLEIKKLEKDFDALINALKKKI